MDTPEEKAERQRQAIYAMNDKRKAAEQHIAELEACAKFVEHFNEWLDANDDTKGLRTIRDHSRLELWARELRGETDDE